MSTGDRVLAALWLAAVAGALYLTWLFGALVFGRGPL